MLLLLYLVYVVIIDSAIIFIAVVIILLLLFLIFGSYSYYLWFDCFLFEIICFDEIILMSYTDRFSVDTLSLECADGFVCPRSDVCLSLDQKCDGIDDCWFLEDEKNCGI